MTSWCTSIWEHLLIAGACDKLLEALLAHLLIANGLNEHDLHGAHDAQCDAQAAECGIGELLDVEDVLDLSSPQRDLCRQWHHARERWSEHEERSRGRYHLAMVLALRHQSNLHRRKRHWEHAAHDTGGAPAC